MGRNRRGTTGFSTPQAERTNKKVGLTLPPEAIERLEALAKARGRTKSEVVAELLLAAKA